MQIISLIKGYWEKLSERDKRAIIVCGIVVTLFLVYIGMVEPLVAYKKKMHDEIQAKTLLLTKYRNFINRKKVFENRLKEAKKDYEKVEKQLFKGNAISVVTSDLQKVVEKLASSSGLKIKTQRMVPPEKNRYYTKIFVELRTESSITQLTEFLKKVEHNNIFIFPTKIVIKALEIRNPKRVKSTICLMGLALSNNLKGENI